MAFEIVIDSNFIFGFLCAIAVMYTHIAYKHNESKGDNYAMLKIVTSPNEDELTTEIFNNVLTTLLEEIYKTLNYEPISSLDSNIILRKHVRRIKITISIGDKGISCKSKMSAVNICISSSPFISILDRVSIVASDYIYTIGKPKTFIIETTLLKQGVEEF